MFSLVRELMVLVVSGLSFLVRQTYITHTHSCIAILVRTFLDTMHSLAPNLNRHN